MPQTNPEIPPNCFITNCEPKVPDGLPCGSIARHLPRLVRAEALCPLALAAVIERKEAEQVRPNAPHRQERMAGRSLSLGGLYLEAALVPSNRADAPQLLGRANEYLDGALQTPRAYKTYLAASLLKIYMGGFEMRSRGRYPRTDYAKGLQPDILGLLPVARSFAQRTRLALHGVYAHGGTLAFPSTGRESGQLWPGAKESLQHELYTIVIDKGDKLKVPHRIELGPDGVCDRNRVIAKSFPSIFREAIAKTTNQQVPSDTAVNVLLEWLQADRLNPSRERAMQLIGTRFRQLREDFCQSIQPPADATDTNSLQ